MIELERQGDVFVLTMTDGENRWNTTLCRELDAALDEVIASEGPAALVTASADTKFFSNGLDLGWITSRGEHPGGDRKAFNNEAMAVLAKMLTLPVPTVCSHRCRHRSEVKLLGAMSDRHHWSVRDH